MVSITLSEFLEVQNARTKAEMEAAQLKEQIRTMKIEANSSLLIAFYRSALELVRFAVASMPPESTRGWPVDHLHAIARTLPSLPDATVDDGDLSITLRNFADECARYESRRRVLDQRDFG
jgi:hypothetical protein